MENTEKKENDKWDTVNRFDTQLESQEKREWGEAYYLPDTALSAFPI